MRSPLHMMVDLREHPADDELGRVASAFSTSLDVSRVQRRRRTIGLPTDRGTWVRVEARPVEMIGGQGLNGIECSSALTGVARPAWHQSVSWRDGELMWRADETELVTGRPIKTDGILTADPRLPDAWWTALTGSLAALAAHTTTRVGTQGMRPITQELISSTIRRVFPTIDTTIDEWTAAHGDFGWQNLTSPECVILDWENWGMAPRGYDAAILWHTSLAVPSLADRVYRELRGDLESRSGLLCQLMGCAIATTVRAGNELITEPAKGQAGRILDRLARVR